MLIHSSCLHSMNYQKQNIQNIHFLVHFVVQDLLTIYMYQYIAKFEYTQVHSSKIEISTNSNVHMLSYFKYYHHHTCLICNFYSTLWLPWNRQMDQFSPLFSFCNEPPIFVKDSIFCSSLLHKSSVLLASVGGGRGMPRPTTVNSVSKKTKPSVLGISKQQILIQ